MPMASIFSTLGAFANRADENYLTEALAIVLRETMARDRDVATGMLDRLFGTEGAFSNPGDEVTI